MSVTLFRNNMPYSKMLPASSLVYSSKIRGLVLVTTFYITKKLASACAFFDLPRRRLGVSGVGSEAINIDSIVDVAKPKAVRHFS